MGTTRKLAIKAYRSTHPEPKPKRELRSVQAPGSFLGLAVACAASCIGGASADYRTERDPKEDKNAFIAFGTVTVALIGIMALAALTQKMINLFNRLPVSHRIAPMSNRILPLPQVEIELYATTTNPKTPLALTGVREAFI